jgi:cell filamentation protein
MPDIYYYEFEYDKQYCYPNSSVLRNKLNLSDENELMIAEREITSLTAYSFNSNLTHLKAL